MFILNQSTNQYLYVTASGWVDASDSELVVQL